MSSAISNTLIPGHTGLIHMYCTIGDIRQWSGYYHDTNLLLLCLVVIFFFPSEGDELYFYCSVNNVLVAVGVPELGSVGGRGFFSGVASRLSISSSPDGGVSECWEGVWEVVGVFGKLIPCCSHHWSNRLQEQVKPVTS